MNLFLEAGAIFCSLDGELVVCHHYYKVQSVEVVLRERSKKEDGSS
jgi:hypothetical protein